MQWTSNGRRRVQSKVSRLPETSLRRPRLASVCLAYAAAFDGPTRARTARYDMLLGPQSFDPQISSIRDSGRPPRGGKHVHHNPQFMQNHGPFTLHGMIYALAAITRDWIRFNTSPALEERPQHGKLLKMMFFFLASGTLQFLRDTSPSFWS